MGLSVHAWSTPARNFSGSIFSTPGSSRRWGMDASFSWAVSRWAISGAFSAFASAGAKTPSITDWPTTRILRSSSAMVASSAARSSAMESGASASATTERSISARTFSGVRTSLAM